MMFEYYSNDLDTIKNTCDEYDNRNTFNGISIILNPSKFSFSLISFLKVLLYMIFQTLIYIFIIYLWLRKRNYFPIKERSPYLVLTSVLTCSISCLIIPLALIIYEFTGITWINPYRYIERSQTYHLTLFIRSFEVVMNAFILFPYILRTIRIYIVFNTRINSRILRFLFSKEGYLILIVIFLCSLFYLFLYFLPGCVPTNLYKFHDDFYEECFLFQQFFWRIFNMMEETLFLLMAYFTRNIYKEYSLCKEASIMTIVNVVYFNVIHLFPTFINFNYVCLGPLPIFFVLKDLRHIIVAMMVTLYPLSICGKAHIPLPPSLTLDDMSFFLLEEKFFVVFYKFLQNLEEKAKEMPKKFNEFNEKLFASKFLRFYLDIRMVGENKEVLENMMINETFFNYLNEEYLKFFGCWLEQIEEINRKNMEKSLVFNDFKELYSLVHSQLNLFFKEFQKTNSYRLLRKTLDENDLVNARLYSYNILSKSD